VCGIAGILTLGDSAARIDADLLERMRDAMTHRGPDGAGLWIDDDHRVGLAHRRLAIVDLSPRAAQPMANEDGAIRIVYNGEIYNHAELRAELERTGRHRWRTDHADTEVILHAYEEWGIGCLERFRGMFAFALWDARQRELLLVRDRLGVKPLYVAHDAARGRIAFASELKALLADPDQRRTVDEESFHHALSFLTVPAPRTLFAGIEKLAAGTWMRVGADGRVEQRRWWDVLDHARLADGTDDALAARVLEELRTAVSLRTRSDVPVGVFLSGGVDSSTNAVLFAQTTAAPLRTFSIGYRGTHASCGDELPHARFVAAKIGGEHHERILEEDDLLDFLPEMVWHQDEPIADPVCVPVHYVSRLARDHSVIVCQVGEGADELFCGYPFWLTQIRLQRWADRRATRPGQAALLAAIRAVGRGDGRKAAWLERSLAGRPIFWGGAESFTDARVRAILSPRLRRRLAGLSAWDAIAPIRARFEEKAWSRDPLSWMTYLDVSVRLPELLLMRVDRMSMIASLEARVPFLDHRFVELAMSVPSAAKIRGGEPKALLKRAVRGVIPDEVIDRPKQGFGVPVREWMGGRLGEVARREIRSFAADADLLDPGAVEALLRRGDASLIWHLLNVALWWRRFIAGEGVRGLPAARASGAPALTA
jgi:asparagine synthase (glutamine-hydrolysing)